MGRRDEEVLRVRLRGQKSLGQGAAAALCELSDQGRAETTAEQKQKQAFKSNFILKWPS